MVGLALSPPCGFDKLWAMKKEAAKQRLKREIAAVMRSMDFVSGHPSLAKGGRGREAALYSGIYRQLALAWEHLALQCRHWDGFKKKRGGVRCCPICGLVEGMEEPWLLLPRRGTKAIGRMARPTSDATFPTEKAATVLDDTIAFHGAKLRVEVCNAFRWNLGLRVDPKPDISVMAHRTVHLAEEGFRCSIERHQIRLVLPENRRPDGPPNGAFPCEFKTSALKRFPIFLECDRRGRLVGLTIFRSSKPKRKRARQSRIAPAPDRS